MVELSAAEQKGIFKRRSDLLKFILSFGVVWGHALNMSIYSLSETSTGFSAFVYQLEYNCFVLFGLMIPMYYFLSGFSYFGNFTLASTLDKWKRRVFTLLIPWLCWNTIVWGLNILIRQIPFIASRLNTDAGYQFTLRSWFVTGLMNSADGPMWFIKNLIVLTLLSPVIYLLIKNKYVGIAAIIGGLAAVYFTNADRFTIPVSLVFFMEAGYCSLHLRPLFLRRYSSTARICAGVLLGLYLIFCRSDSFQSGGLVHVLTFTVVNLILWVLAGDKEMSETAKKLNGYRFWIYSSHYFPLESIEKVFLMVFGTSGYAALADFILAPALTLILVIALGWTVKKYLPTVWAVLNGYISPYKKKPVK